MRYALYCSHHPNAKLTHGLQHRDPCWRLHAVFKKFSLNVSFRFTMRTHNRPRKGLISKQCWNTTNEFVNSFVHAFLFLYQATFHNMKSKVTVSCRSIDCNNQMLIAQRYSTQQCHWNLLFLDYHVHAFQIRSKMAPTTGKPYHFFNYEHVHSMELSAYVNFVE